MIAPSPYGRTPRPNGTSCSIPPRPAPHWSKTRAAPKPAKPCPPEVLDRDLLGRFSCAGRATFLQLMEGFRPRWATEAYDRLLERGLILEDEYSARVTITAAGREELTRGLA